MWNHSRLDATIAGKKEVHRISMFCGVKMGAH